MCGGKHKFKINPRHTPGGYERPGWNAEYHGSCVNCKAMKIEYTRREGDKIISEIEIRSHF